MVHLTVIHILHYCKKPVNFVSTMNNEHGINRVHPDNKDDADLPPRPGKWRGQTDL